MRTLQGHRNMVDLFDVYVDEKVRATHAYNYIRMYTRTLGVRAHVCVWICDMSALAKRPELSHVPNNKRQRLPALMLSAHSTHQPEARPSCPRPTVPLTRAGLTCVGPRLLTASTPINP